MEKLKLISLYSEFREDLDYIENKLEQSVTSSSPIIQEASLHLLRAGGKRIRPIFVILSSQFGNCSLEEVAKVAVSLELVHMASLVHDDVIDDSDMRRGFETVKSRWDNRVAMYTGDFIFSRALTTMGEIELAAVHELLADTMLEICKGEIIQIDYQGKINQSIRDYLRRIKRKTALLLSSSCELGALVSRTDEATVLKLKRFGYFSGMAFQIIDDILDITSTDEKLGKPAGSDLINGHLTLPILFIKNDVAFQPYLRAALDGTISEQDRLKMLKYIKSTDAIKKAQFVSNLYLQKALNELRGLPECDAKKSLKRFVAFIGKRQY